MAKDYRYEKRKYVIGGMLLLVTFVYVLRLFDLQILSDEYKRYADSNAFLNATGNCWCSISRPMMSYSSPVRWRGWIHWTSAAC